MTRFTWGWPSTTSLELYRSPCKSTRSCHSVPKYTSSSHYCNIELSHLVAGNLLGPNAGLGGGIIGHLKQLKLVARSYR